MNRRPWPIVLMAILQFLSPFLYIAVAAMFYHLSLSATTNEVLELTPDLRKFEIFFLPIILSGLILLTRKWGYYLVVLGSIYLIARGIIEFKASNNTDPVFPLVLSNLVCLVVVVILIVGRKTRAVYFNPRLRWWETSPRYIVGLTASVTRVGARPLKAELKDIAAGGAGLNASERGFLRNEIVNLEFQYEGEPFQLKAKVAWEKEIGDGKEFLGLQWADDNTTSGWSKIRRLLRTLKQKRTPTTRGMPGVFTGVKDWFSKLAG